MTLRPWLWLPAISVLGCTLGYSEDELAGGTRPTAASACADYRSAVAADAPLLWHSLDARGAEADATLNSGITCSFGENVEFESDDRAEGCVGTRSVHVGFDPPSGARGFFTCEGAALGFSGSTGFTFEVWLMLPAALQGFPRIMSREWLSANGREGYDVLVAADGAELQFERWNADDSDGAYASLAPLLTTGFHHLVASYDGVTASLYVDGGLRSSAASVKQIASDPSARFALGIAGYLVGEPGQGMDARFDEAAVYAGALSADRVLEHYRQGRGQ
ncbi:MAG: LamG domain-containing protein [Polyangiaceae bacterium]